MTQPIDVSTKRVSAPVPTFEDRSGRPVALRVFGAEQASITVLALHSIGLNGRSFRPLAHALADIADVRLFALDLRGHGKRADVGAFDFDDYVDDAVRAIACIGSPVVHVVGHSLGGAIAASAVAKLAPEAGCTVGSLSLLASPAQGGEVFRERAADCLSKGMDVMREATLLRWFGGVQQDVQDHQFAARSLAEMRVENFAAAWAALAQFEGYADLVDRLPRTLAIAGAEDLSTPPAVMARIGTAFEQAGRASLFTQVDLPQSGHMYPLAATPTLAESLLEHWRKNA